MTWGVFVLTRVLQYESGTLTHLLHKFTGVDDDAEPVSTLSVEHILRFCVQVTFTVARLHERGVVHNGLKPDNVLVRRRSPLSEGKSEGDDDGGHYDCLIADFGMAVKGEPGAESYAVPIPVKTSAWTPPEQFTDNTKTSTAVDVYQLGLLMHVMLTGGRDPPERDEDPTKTAVDIDGEELEYLYKEVADTHTPVAERLKALIEECWRTNPTDRPSAEYVLRKLQGIYGGVKVSAT